MTMKKKYKNLFKKCLKYIILVVSIFVLWNYLSDVYLKKKRLINSDFGNFQLNQESIIRKESNKLPILIDSISNLNLFNQFLYNSSIFTSFCPYISPYLTGKLQVDENILDLQDLEKKFSTDFTAGSGGHWKPKDCQAQSKVAIIVPYRDRDAHLRLFLNHMHSFLRRQLIEYAIYIIEEVKK